VEKAASQVAARNGLDIVLSGSCVFGGGKAVANNGIDITQFVIQQLRKGSSASGSKRAQLFTPGIGYFDLDSVLSYHEPYEKAKQMQSDAEARLRNIVAKNSQVLKDNANRGVSQSEINRKAYEMKEYVSSLQKSLTKEVLNEQRRAASSLAKEISSVAKQNGLTIVVTENAVFVGKDLAFRHGTDVTVKILSNL